MIITHKNILNKYLRISIRKQSNIICAKILNCLILSIGLVLLVSTSTYSQSRVDSIVQIGIKYYDNGQFDKAIETYKDALQIELNSPLVNYEIAMTYMYAKDYNNAIKHSDIVIDMKDKYLLEAYITKGCCLDYLGKSKEAIKLFNSGINKFGDNYLLHYNIGLTYYKLSEYDKAEESLINAIKNNADHSSSHLLLGYLKADQNQRVQSLLCLNYFLFLEPDSDRAKIAYNILQKQFSDNVERNKDKPNEISILYNPNQSGSEFGPADLMISMLEASNSIEQNKSKSDEVLFIENTESFFKILGELKNKKSKGLWWDLYVPFFSDIANSDHIDTYCYYISQSSNYKAKDWLKENENKINEFSIWLSKR